MRALYHEAEAERTAMAEKLEMQVSFNEVRMQHAMRSMQHVTFAHARGDSSNGACCTLMMYDDACCMLHAVCCMLHVARCMSHVACWHYRLHARRSCGCN